VRTAMWIPVLGDCLLGIAQPVLAAPEVEARKTIGLLSVNAFASITPSMTAIDMQMVQALDVDSQNRHSRGQMLVESYVRGTDAQVNKLSFGQSSFGICFLRITFDKVNVIPVRPAPTTPVALP
jgi:hypothetical protein